MPAFTPKISSNHYGTSLINVTLNSLNSDQTVAGSQNNFSSRPTLKTEGLANARSRDHLFIRREYLQEEFLKMSSIFLFPAILFARHLSTNSKNWSRFSSSFCDALSLFSPFISHVTAFRSQLCEDGAKSTKSCSLNVQTEKMRCSTYGI